MTATTDTRTGTFRDAIREGLREEMAADPSVFLLGEDVGRYGGAYAISKGLLDEFGPKRVLDTPMSEAGIVGLALGASVVGGRPVSEVMYMDFITLVMDQLVNQAAKLHFMFGNQLRAPLVVRTQQGVGRGAGSQHSQSLEAWLTHVPGLRVVAPATPADAKGLLKSAIREPNPVVYIEHKQLYARKDTIPGPDHMVPLGSARVARDGADLTVITYSSMVHVALDAAERLAADGLDVEVVDLRCLSPVDWDTVTGSVGTTRRALVLHEACLTGGLGAEIAARLGERLFGQLSAPVRRVTTPDVILPANLDLERRLVPDVDRIVAEARDLLSHTKS